MRRFLPLTVVLLATACITAPPPLTGAAQPSAAPAPPHDVAPLRALAAAFPGHAGVWVAGPGGGTPWLALNPDDRFVAASLYKLAVLVHVESLVEQHHLSYRDTLLIEPADLAEGSLVVDSGAELTVNEALELMITESDNATGAAFWRIHGAAAINATLAAQRVPDVRLGERYEDENIVTARGAGVLFTRMLSGTLVSRAASERMAQRLARQTINDRLPSGLPAGTVVAHKTGNLDGVTHDAGIVLTPAGPVIVVVLTEDSATAEANEFIAALASRIYEMVRTGAR